MAEKLIPGIPHATRIAILQQTDDDNDHGGNASIKVEKSILESVLSSDETRNEAMRRADCKYNTVIFLRIRWLTRKVLTKSFETGNPLAPVRALRKIRHQQAEKKLFLAQKNASLKSGARGLQARKDLKTAEGRVESTAEM